VPAAPALQQLSLLSTLPGLMPAAPPGPADKSGSQATRRSYVDLDEGNELMEDHQVGVLVVLVRWCSNRWGQAACVAKLGGCPA
jgi:hypothetical protein